MNSTTPFDKSAQLISEKPKGYDRLRENFEEFCAIINHLEKLNVPYYIHAGFAMHLQGLKGDIEDIDFRICHSNIDNIYEYIKEKCADMEVKMNGPRAFEGGVLDNKCIHVKGKLQHDICTNLIQICDLGRVEFPFNLAVFKSATRIKYEGIDLPVASLESLLAYYLMLRRTVDKADIDHIYEIIADKRFDVQKFTNLISQSPLKRELMTLYRKYASRIQE